MEGVGVDEDGFVGFGEYPGLLDELRDVLNRRD
jgi:hypothetical protein